MYIYMYLYVCVCIYIHIHVCTCDLYLPKDGEDLDNCLVCFAQGLWIRWRLGAAGSGNQLVGTQMTVVISGTYTYIQNFQTMFFSTNIYIYIFILYIYIYICIYMLLRRYISVHDILRWAPTRA